MTTTNTVLEYSHTLGFMANLGRGFNNPVDLAIDSQGVVFVLNRAGPEVGVRIAYKRITLCTADEQYLGEICTGGTGDGQLWWPSSIAIDQEDRLYVADEALNRVTIFDRQGNFLGKWGVNGAGPGQFNRPSCIVIDGDGNLVVADSLNHRIQKYGLDGTFVAQFGEFGAAPGQFNMPWGIAVDGNGDLLVSDWRNDRIQRFDATGAFIAANGESGGGPAQFNRPAGLAVDSEGNIIVADWGNERVQALDPKGKFLATFRGESRDSLWAQDYFEVNPEEAAARRAAHLEPDIASRPEFAQHRGYEWERSANVEKLFWGPTSVKVGPDALVYVVDSLRHRVQIFRQPAQG